MASQEAIGQRLMSHIVSFNMIGRKGRQQKGFIAERILGDFENRDQVGKQEIDRFLERYVTPRAFWRSATRFVDFTVSVRGENATYQDALAKQQEYYRSLSSLGKTIYGKRWTEFVKKNGLEIVVPETAYSIVGQTPQSTKFDIQDEVMEPIVQGAYGYVRHRNIAFGVFDGENDGGRFAAQITRSEFHKETNSMLEGDSKIPNSIARMINQASKNMNLFHGEEHPTMESTVAYAALSAETRHLVTVQMGTSRIAVLKENGQIVYPTKGRSDNIKIGTEIKPEDLKKEGIVDDIALESDWVCVLGLTDGITANLTPEEISQAMNSKDLISGKIPLSESLKLLTGAAQKKASAQPASDFKPTPDDGFTAAGFTI